VVKTDNVPEILAVMATAGLYHDSGKWFYTTGLPVKSGVDHTGYRLLATRLAERQFRDGFRHRSTRPATADARARGDCRHLQCGSAAILAPETVSP